MPPSAATCVWRLSESASRATLSEMPCSALNCSSRLRQLSPAWNRFITVYGALITAGVVISAILGKPGLYVLTAVFLGAMLVPFIHLSVYMFRTIHPRPVVLNPEGPTMPGSFVATLLFSLTAFTLLYLRLVTIRYGVGRLGELREARDVPAA